MEFIVISLVLGGMAFLAGVPLNFYILFVAGCRMGRTASTVWFLNRAVADLIFIVFLPLRYIFLLRLNWATKLSSTITSFHMFSSAFLLMALSVDRCILVARPEWARNHRTPRLAFMIVLVIWALSLGFSLRYVGLLGSLTPPRHSTDTDEGRVKAAVAIQFLVGFLIPLALILIPTFYIVLAAKLRRKRLIQSTKPLKILLGLIPAFFLCWLPYHVSLLLILDTYHPPHLMRTVIVFTSVLTYFSTWLNPIFYLTMEEEYLRYRQHARNPQTTDNLGPEPAE
ncbi:chemokine-like receptor 1 [Terrapene carolina triunguis]|uniref:chemokine-like receptor 1 n=1 Tax=Terrapene triunguis TaxID=2587831 RepID=UPI000CEF8470|nr:chemokine-like receptor 1 [Terrapene carolina triunguis]